MSLHAQLSPEAQERLNAQRRNSTVTSVIIALLLIVLVGLILAFILLPALVKETPVIVSYQGASLSEETVDTKKVTNSLSRKPSAPSSAMSKVIAANTTSSIAVPVPEIDVPVLSSDFGDSNDFGDGWGDGSGDGGAGGGGIVMFGKDLKVNSIGVIMDISGSMVPHLKNVIDEVDKRASGSPMIVHPGCSVAPLENVKIRMRPVSAGRNLFKRTWYLYHDRETRSFKNDRDIFARPIPMPEVFMHLHSRPETYFTQLDDGGHAWGKSMTDVLTARELRDVEAIYWFADFQDLIDDEEAARVVKILVRRKQKLFLHASSNGRFLQTAIEKMAVPTGGRQL